MNQTNQTIQISQPNKIDELNQAPQFFYRQGHCQELAQAEFSAMTKSANPLDLIVRGGYLWSNSRVNVNTTGSLVFGAVELYRLKNFDYRNGKKELQEVLFDNVQIGRMNDKFKKLGISIPKKFASGVLDKVKKAGAKKVNMLLDQTPNFGHWKQSTDWLIILEDGQDVVLGEIRTYFDQEFFANLDVDFPHADMSRGIINLKLGRSLLNLTQKTTIWDPFAGLGRIPAAGLDMKKAYLMSDKDDLVMQMDENLAYARQYFEKKSRQKRALASVGKAFVQDAMTIGSADLKEILPDGCSDLAIVTEGFLGVNKRHHTHTEEEIEQNFRNILELWQQVLQQTQDLGISEVIFCLPYYVFNKQVKLFPYLDQIVERSDYTYEQLGMKESYLLYAREKTVVGHMVVKVVR